MSAYGGLIPTLLHRSGWNLARRGPNVPSSVPSFTPIGATRRPCRAKNLKIVLWIT